MIVAQRLRDRFAHRLQPGKVNNRFNGVSDKNVVECRFVQQINLVESKRFTRQCLHPAQRFHLAVSKIVHNDDFITGV